MIICTIFNFISCVAAALALLDQPNLDAEAIVRKSMKIAGDICVYTNHNVLLEKLDVVTTPVTPAI
jgi:ATP-dependent protease HslVU (ClpYQ) peptidase subunit